MKTDISQDREIDEQLKTFEFFALLRRHEFGERFAIPEPCPVFEIVNEQVRVPRYMQRPPPDTAQKQKRAIVVPEVRSFRRADIAGEPETVCLYPTDLERRAGGP
jgi:hypothetical protein